MSDYFPPAREQFGQAGPAGKFLHTVFTWAEAEAANTGGRVTRTTDTVPPITYALTRSEVQWWSARALAEVSVYWSARVEMDTLLGNLQAAAEQTAQDIKTGATETVAAAKTAWSGAQVALVVVGLVAVAWILAEARAIRRAIP